MASPTRQALASVWPPTRIVSSKAGHRPMSPMQAIRRKCLDCSGHQLAEVKLCEAVGCSLWPFRAGRHPYTTRGLQEADLEQGPLGGTMMPAKAASSRKSLQDTYSRQGDATHEDSDRLSAFSEQPI
jgi:hypothetical protein